MANCCDGAISISMIKYCTIVSLTTAFLLVGIAPSFGDNGAVPITAAFRESGWQHRSFFGKSPAIFTANQEGAMAVNTDGSTSVLYRDVDQEAAGRSVLRWRWRVDQAPPATDLSQKGGDDRALTLHLWFPAPDDDEALFGSGGLGHVLTYVWGGNHAPGTMMENPFLSSGVIIVLENADAPLATWRDVQVDWAQDFKTAFGTNAPTPSRIGLSADSDDTGSTSRGVFRDIRFEMP